VAQIKKNPFWEGVSIIFDTSFLLAPQMPLLSLREEEEKNWVQWWPRP